MTHIRLRAHIIAMSSTMEIIIIASVIALLADIGWLLHDIHVNGLSIWYSAVGSGLLLGTLLTIFALIKHHLDNVNHGIKTMLTQKLLEQKARNRTKRHLELVRSRK